MYSHEVYVDNEGNRIEWTREDNISCGDSILYFREGIVTKRRKYMKRELIAREMKTKDLKRNAAHKE